MAGNDGGDERRVAMKGGKRCKEGSDERRER